MAELNRAAFFNPTLGWWFGFGFEPLLLVDDTLDFPPSEPTTHVGLLEEKKKNISTKKLKSKDPTR